MTGIVCVGLGRVVFRQCVGRRIQTAGPSAGDGGGFKQFNLPALLHGRNRCGQSGPARADDGEVFRSQTVQRRGLKTAQGLHLPSQPKFAQRRQRHALFEHREFLGFDFTQQGAVNAGHHQAWFLGLLVG